MEKPVEYVTEKPAKHAGGRPVQSPLPHKVLITRLSDEETGEIIALFPHVIERTDALRVWLAAVKLFPSPQAFGEWFKAAIEEVKAERAKAEQKGQIK